MRKILSGNRPDLTPAQIVAGIPVIATLLNVFGVYHLSQEQQDALSDAVSWAFVLIGADTLLRVGRAHADAKVKAAALEPGWGAPAGPPDAVHPVETPLSPQEIARELDEPNPDTSVREDGLPFDAEEEAFPPPGQ